jgi:hypothetical protein
MGEPDREKLLADLFKAIIWYSNENNYESDVEKDITDIELDRGSKARAVLRTMTEYDQNKVGEVYEGED